MRSTSDNGFSAHHKRPHTGPRRPVAGSSTHAQRRTAYSTVNIAVENISSAFMNGDHPGGSFTPSPLEPASLKVVSTTTATILSVIKVTMKASKTNDGQYDDIDPYFDARTDTTSHTNVRKRCTCATLVDRNSQDMERPERARLCLCDLWLRVLCADGDGESTEYDFSRCSSTSFGVIRPTGGSSCAVCDAVVESSMARAICAACWLPP